jgi:hypothetical protein
VAKLTAAVAAAVKSKAAVVVLATLVAVGALGVGTAAAASNGAFGQQVKAQVESCKDALAKGVHGIGDCVSDLAQQHGKQQHQQSHPATVNHGQQVKEQVQDCKQAAASNGKNGIGDCVSDFAQQHGKQQQHQH